ncbi:hypothetical protein PR048_002220 [Dryococelus australis]|uniref:Uncharacterized protein n=1 Tax=Dryococelus australis TaxID=614101 RepID=A0ABQ9IKZ2_9NEOP|nr:hypothetical protein PR048_002220 [Dryococelus australis]
MRWNTDVRNVASDNKSVTTPAVKGKDMSASHAENTHVVITTYAHDGQTIYFIDMGEYLEERLLEYFVGRKVVSRKWEELYTQSRGRGRCGVVHLPQGSLIPKSSPGSR